VVRLAADFVPVKVNTEGSSRELAVAAKYRVWSLPTILFLSPQGHQLFRVNGFQGPGQFPRTLDAARRVATRVMAWEAALEANPDDPAALVALGSHLYQQEYFEEARDLLRKATQQDTAAPVDDRRQARLLLAMLANSTHDYAEAERLVKEALTLQPDSEDQPQLLFVLGRTYVSSGRQAEGVATFEVIVREYPRSPVAQKAKETLSSLRHR
jgi:tetratricopeptide (TPR) repeat protein